MCLYPQLIRNRKYQPNKKNKGHPAIIKDERTRFVPVGCGKCIECLRQESRQWKIRLSEEIKTSKNGTFITLTYSDESIKQLTEYTTKELEKEIKKCKTFKEQLKIENKMSGYALDNEIATKSVRLFLERYRKKYGKSIKHWLVTELGTNGTENIHLHGIIWTENIAEIEKIWQYGYIWKGQYVNERTINYIVKYITKSDIKHTTYKPRILTSKGIGKKYTETTTATENRYNGTETKETYRTNTGHKIALPIYYRNRIYTEEEREKLWLQKLDKEERFVLGQRIDVSETYNEYNEALKEAQEKNERLGYGKPQVKWNTEKYENQRRDLLRLKRTQNG